MDWNIHIKSQIKIPGCCHSQWCLHQHISIYLKTCHFCLNRNPLLFPSREFSELLHRDIGHIDDISNFKNTRTLLWLNKTCYYRKKWVLLYPKLVWIMKWCHLFFEAIWILLMMIAPYCRKQLGLSASSCWLWKAPVPVYLSCVAASSGGAEASFVCLLWYTTPIQSCMACRPAAMESVSLS